MDKNPKAQNGLVAQGIMKYHEVMSLILGLHTQTMPALMWR